ncbi:2,5-diketo-D-gluconate reductase A [Sphingobium sp. YR657]|uniref:aldo/keto reductase n=1 Tax=Sphingobium sp. YR657 TaxID=1884366 RepID=UPI00092068C9|nr:aldo/keto reductase [Sphingobium sp. YR657]SHM45603.1 2,5-diketo-D-gluconate reductase A [Sphingobium sp. YR657]
MSQVPEHIPLEGGLSIPAEGFGTYPIPSDAAVDAVCQAISIGYRHIDTAEAYGNEQGVGAGIREGLRIAGIPREQMFVTTKLWPGGVERAETVKSRAAVIASCDDSLSKLGLDYIDLYLIHAPHAGPGRIEQWAALLDLRQSGKVRAVGVSNFGQAHIDEIKSAGLALPQANQLELHPWAQKPALIAYLREAHIQPIAYSSLAPLSTWRAEKHRGIEKDVDASFAALAAKYRVSEAQLLLRWGLQSGYAVLPKSTDPDRMRQNLALFGFAIDGADMAAMEAMNRDASLAWPNGDPTLIA